MNTFEGKRVVVLVDDVHSFYHKGDCGVCIAQHTQTTLIYFDKGEEWYVPVEHVAVDEKSKPLPVIKKRSLLDKLLDKVLAGDP